MAQDADDPRARHTKEERQHAKRNAHLLARRWRQLARSGRWCT